MDLSKTMRRGTLRWYVALPLLAAMLLLFWLGHVQNERKLEELKEAELELNRELTSLTTSGDKLSIRLENLTSNGQMDAAAREQDFMRVGELRFVIDNSENQLEKYTQEEWDILMKERELGQY